LTTTIGSFIASKATRYPRRGGGYSAFSRTRAPRRDARRRLFDD